MSKTLKALAKEALAVQDACNLCGVAQSFARAMRDLGDHTIGTDARNKHPIAILWADKIAHLTGTQTFNDDVARAYGAVHEIIEEADQEQPAQ